MPNANPECRRVVRRAVIAFFAVFLGDTALAQSATPPRSTADILAILDEHKPDPAQVDQLRNEVAKEPPQTTDRVDLRRFYTSRGLAAGQLGMVNQQLADLKKALELMPPGDSERWNIYVQIANAEQQTGDFVAATRMWMQAPKVAVGPGQRIGAWVSVSSTSAGIGDIATARKGLAEAESLLTRLRFETFAWPAFNNAWRGGIARARGNILRLEGKHAEAELAYREAIALMDEYIVSYPQVAQDRRFRPGPLSNTVRTAALWEINSLVPALLEQGKYAEAEASARNALKRVLGFFGRFSPETGTALQRLAQVVFEQGRSGEASALAKAAVDIYEKIGAAPGAATVVFARRTMAASLLAEGKFSEADAIFALVRDALLKSPDSAERLGTGSFGWVYAQVQLGRTAEAVDQARTIYEIGHKRYGEAFYYVLEARGFLALALAADKRYEEALREFRAAIPALLAAASERTSGEGLGIGRTRRLTRILESYIRLLGNFAEEKKVIEGFDPAAEAFLIADVARGSSVQRALTAASARAAIRDPQLAQLAREEQDAGQRAAALTGILLELLARPADKSLPAVIKAMRRDIGELGKRRAQLKQEVGKRFPEYSNLIDPKPVTLEGARRVLVPGETLIALYGTEDRTFVWALPHEGEARFHVAALGRAERDRLVSVLRRAFDVDGLPLERFPVFEFDAAYKLHSTLLAPLESTWGSAKSLLIVPHGSLAQLPFALFVTRPGALSQSALPFEGYKQVAWLLQRIAITQLPSVNTLASLRSVARARAPTKPFIGFGNPVFGTQELAAAAVSTRSIRLRNAPFEDTAAARRSLSARLSQLTSLPDTAEELDGIAKALGAMPQQDLYLGVRASEWNAKTVDLSERRVVAFATHGLIAGDVDGLTQPALALSNPQVTGEKDADGLLTMDEILGLKLNADWVVLSACNTASAGGASAEAVSGLGRAFFYAGARALLVSNWPVETVSAKLLTTDIFRRQAGDAKLPRAEALRQAMLHLMQNENGSDSAGKPFSYAHPMFWAPFALVGDGN